MRLRQVALVARSLEPVVADCCAVLGISVGFRDPDIAMFGLRNAVMPVGDTFLEVVSPIQEGTTAGRLLERHGGDGGYMVIVQTDDLAGDRRRLETLGVRIVFEVAFDDVATVHLHPRDVGGAIVSLDEARPPESWRWAGPEWRAAVRTDVSTEIVGVDVAAHEPAVMARRWGEVLARPVAERGDGAHEIALDRGVIRFVPACAPEGAFAREGTGARGARAREGVCALDVRVADGARALAAARARHLPAAGDGVRIGGVRLRLC